jgi:hypothetical protein
MRKFLLGALLAYLTHAYALGQTLVQGRVQRQPGDISHVAACERAATFVQLIGLAPQPMAQMSAHLRENHRQGEPGRVWIVGGPQYTLFVNSISGDIYLFEFTKRVEDQFKRRGRTGQVRFTNWEAAKEHLWSLARRLGVPSNAVISSHSFTGEGHRKDQNSAGYFAAAFKVGNKVVATISCDMQDGAPTLITLSP